MHTSIIMWKPNESWQALSEKEKKGYLLGLNAHVQFVAKEPGVITTHAGVPGLRRYNQEENHANY